jgi:hypothetical protein
MRSRLIFLFLMFLIFSCSSQEVCEDEVQSDLVARFKTMESGTSRDTTITGVTLYGIREGLPGNLLYDSASLSRIVVPLDPNSDHTTFLLKVNDLTDTIRIDHQSGFYLVSYACGFASLFTLEEIDFSGDMILTAEITKSQIDAEMEQNEEHLWIYF